MFGYERKVLELSHAAAQPVTFTVEVDVAADSSWSEYARFTVPLHRPPEDLLTIDLASVYPELAGKRVRGRLVDEGPKGKRVVPTR